MEDGSDRLNTWLMASAEEWRIEPSIQDFFERLANTENARRYLELFGQLMNLSIEELGALTSVLNRQEEHYGD